MIQLLADFIVGMVACALGGLAIYGLGTVVDLATKCMDIYTYFRTLVRICLGMLAIGTGLFFAAVGARLRLG